MKILVLGSNERSVLATIRSLGRAECEIDVFGLSKYSVVSHSKYTNNYYYLDTDIADQLKNYILDLVSTNAYDLILPCVDIFCLLIERDRVAYEKYAKISLPKNGSYEKMSDKKLLIDTSNKYNILTPITKCIIKGSQIKESLISDVSFPIYAKPRYSVLIHNGRLQTTQVRKLHNKHQLLKYLSDYIYRVDVLLQDVVPGVGKSAYIFAVEGKVISIMSQIRLHEPKIGGGSSYRSTCELDDYLLDSSSRLALHYKWTGPMMIEYKHDPESNKYYIMEINARLWGSLPLTINSGHDIPKYTYEYFSRGVVPKSNKTIIGLTQRHLVRDIGWLFSNKRRVSEYFSWLVDFKRGFYGREFFDVERKEDFMPAIWSYYFLLKNRLSQTRRIVGIVSNSINFLSLFQIVNKRRLIKIFQKKEINNILFVCRGNVARSAYCENWSKSHIPDCNFLSAGTIGVEGRHIQPEILDIATDADLHHHRSVALDSIDRDWPDIIFIMDARNLYEIKAFKFDSHLIFPLSCLSTLGQIKDPDKIDSKEVPDIVRSIRDNLTQFKRLFKESLFK